MSINVKAEIAYQRYFVDLNFSDNFVNITVVPKLWKNIWESPSKFNFILIIWHVFRKQNKFFGPGTPRITSLAPKIQRAIWSRDWMVLFNIGIKNLKFWNVIFLLLLLWNIFISEVERGLSRGGSKYLKFHVFLSFEKFQKTFWLTFGSCIGLFKFPFSYKSIIVKDLGFFREI